MTYHKLSYTLGKYSISISGTAQQTTVKDYTQLQTAFKWEINFPLLQLRASDSVKSALFKSGFSQREHRHYQVQKSHRAVRVAKGETHPLTARCTAGG